MRKQILAHGEMHARLCALHQHVQPCGLELVAIDRVEARVRNVEQSVDVVHQRVRAVDHMMTIDAPALYGKPAALLRVLELQHGMGREARAQDRSHVLVRPVDHLDERLPEWLAPPGPAG